MILIGCRGGSTMAHSLLVQAGWRYGFRSDYKPYPLVTEDNPVWFVDIKWKDYDWPTHLSVLDRWQPVMAMAADYEYPEQKSLMLAQVDQIRDLGIKPMVCPKFSGAAYDIPAGCVVAVSVPTQYAGFLPDREELEGRELHLLGGHPDQFVLLTRLYNQSEVISIDCSAIFQKAKFGAYWEPKENDWYYTPKNTSSTDSLVVKSAQNVKKYLDNPPKSFGLTAWNNRRAMSTYQMRMSLCY